MKTLTLLLLAILLLCPGARAAEPGPELPPGTRAIKAGAPAPFAGVVIPGDTLRALLKAQDERDELRAALTAAAEQCTIDVGRVDNDLVECRAVSDACERARSGCEASRVPPAVERPWSGWPWLAGAAGVVVGAGLTILVVEAVR